MDTLHRVKRAKSDERGFALLYVVLAMMVIMASTAIALDIGKMVHHKIELGNWVDAAALAGALELPDEGDAETYAEEYLLVNNGGDGTGLEYEFPDTSSGRIRVTATRQVPFSFARVLGFEESTVSAAATVIRGVISGLGGVIPIGVEDDIFLEGSAYGPITLKVGGGEGSCGNYKALALGGTGADVYEGNLHDGYDGVIRVGDTFDTETGVMAGPTKSGLKDRLACSHTLEDAPEDCPRFVYVPIVAEGSFGEINGRDEVKIVGFALFFLESVSGQGVIEGTFVKKLTEGEVSSSGKNYGLEGIKLVE
ncbi:MAG: TadG family pilus assembly protein [Bacillota bacterium]|nr:TadG family pilus assembly protein [Bacillota bacterium]MDD3298228.1 TadG family pilus assembly protein [Bacillota bacterium]MDD3850659.1 TadG family pilus assembly protein [Bacillota bacterium]MDD4707791.1 TadG family pilus assembly protein [Bacillota bacterium]